MTLLNKRLHAFDEVRRPKTVALIDGFEFQRAR
jgi:hypothetical protein